MADVRPIRVGETRVTIINAGDMTLRLADELAVPETLWRPQYADIFDRHGLYPSLSVLIQHAGVTTLVDTNDYRATITAESAYYVPDYTPPPSIADQLASMGVKPEDVDHLVITHAHWDHFAGVTQPHDGGFAPTYPRARLYLGAADWDYEETQSGLADPASVETRTLGLMRERGLLELLPGPRTLAPGIDVLPSPGETPGHQIVRVRSGGETLYALGDLFHSEVEIEHPDWMVTWATPDSMLASRQRLMEDALAENALLIAAHIASPGRLERTATGMRWQAVG